MLNYPRPPSLLFIKAARRTNWARSSPSAAERAGRGGRGAGWAAPPLFLRRQSLVPASHKRRQGWYDRVGKSSGLLRESPTPISFFVTWHVRLSEKPKASCPRAVISLGSFCVRTQRLRFLDPKNKSLHHQLFQCIRGERGSRGRSMTASYTAPAGFAPKGQISHWAGNPVAVNLTAPHPLPH